jgi:hypothetical protein
VACILKYHRCFIELGQCLKFGIVAQTDFLIVHDRLLVGFAGGHDRRHVVYGSWKRPAECGVLTLKELKLEYKESGPRACGMWGSGECYFCSQVRPGPDKAPGTPDQLSRSFKHRQLLPYVSSTWLKYLRLSSDQDGDPTCSYI